MSAPAPPTGASRVPRLLGDRYARVVIVAACALAAELVLARAVLDARPGFVPLLAPLWIVLAYRISGWRSRTSEIVADAALVAAAPPSRPRGSPSTRRCGSRRFRRRRGWRR